jgi:regulator of replication initiation timing
MTNSLMLSTSDAYVLAQHRGFGGSKEQLRMMARETPQDLEKQYGLAYSSTPKFSRNAKNWQDMRPGDAPKVAPAKRKGSDRAAARTVAAPSAAPAAMGTIQDVSELAKVLSWFTQEVEQLRQQLKQLQTQKTAPGVSSQVLDQLQAENETLKAENAALRDKVNHVQQVLGIVDEEPSYTPAPVAADAPAPTRRRKGGKRGPAPRGRAASDMSGLDPNVNRALEAIFNYNNQSGLSKDDKWAVSYPVMKDLLKQVGAATQPKIKQVFDARRDEINRHHQSHGLSSRHNRVHGDRSISDYIQL